MITIAEKDMDVIKASERAQGWQDGFKDGLAHAEKQGIISQVFDALDDDRPLTVEQYAFARKIGLTCVTEDMNPE